MALEQGFQTFLKEFSFTPSGVDYIYEGDIAFSKEEVEYLFHKIKKEKGNIADGFEGIALKRYIWKPEEKNKLTYSFITDMATDSLTNNNVRNAFLRAANAWNKIGGISLSQVNSGGVFTVQTVNESEEYTAMSFFPNSHYEPTIKVNLRFVDDTYNTFDKMVGLFLHEIGHALGLAHEHQRSESQNNYGEGRGGEAFGRFDPNSVMSYDNRPYLNGISVGDMATILYLYNRENLTAASWGLGRLDVFNLDIYNNVQQLWYENGWHWSRLENKFGSNSFVGPLTAVSWGPGRLDVFGIDPDGNILQLWYENGWHWSRLESEFSTNGFVGPLTAVSWGPGRLDIFGLDQDRNVLQLWYENGWHWSRLVIDFDTNGFTGPLTAVSWKPGRLDIFGLGRDGNVLQLWYENGWHWSRIESEIGTNYFGGPLTAVSWGLERIDIFGLDYDRKLVQLWYDRNRWHWSRPNVNLGSYSFVKPLSAASWEPERLDIFGLDINGDILQLWYQNEWQIKQLGNSF